MTINTAANATVSIGTTAAIDETSEATAIAAFQADTYSAVGEIEDIGEFGDSYNSVTFNALNDARVRKLKGSADAGNMTMTVALDSNDAGQAALLAALDDTVNDYNFKIVLNDAITTGSGSGGTELYFYGKVMAFPVSPGSAETVVRRTLTVGVNSTVYQQDAT